MIRTFAAAAMLLTLPTAAQAVVPKSRATVTLTSHRFTPGPIYLAAGIPVRLILLNRAGKSHNFTAEQFFQNARILRGRAPGGEVRLLEGRSAVIDLIPRRGTYKVRCTEFGHQLLGMSTMIVVL